MEFQTVYGLHSTLNVKNILFDLGYYSQIWFSSNTKGHSILYSYALVNPVITGSLTSDIQVYIYKVTREL